MDTSLDPRGQLLLWLVQIVALSASTVLMQRRLPDPRPRGAERALEWALLFFAQVVVVFYLLGSIGLLSSLWILLGFLLVLAVLIACEILAPKRQPAVPEQAADEASDLLALGAVAAVSFFVLATVLHFRLTAPLASDSLIYHLTMPARWLQAGSLEIYSAFFHEPAPGYSPIGAELFFTWLMAPFGSDIVARFGQVPALAGAAVAFYLLGRRLGAAKRIAALGACALAMVPFHFYEALLANVDVIHTFVFIAACLYVLRLTRGGDRDTLMAGVSVGLLFAVKYTTIIYAVPLAAVLVAALLERRKAAEGIRKLSIWILAAGAVAVLAIGSYTYLRNLIVAGSPFFPSGVRLFGVTVFRGLYDASDAAHLQGYNLVSWLGLIMGKGGQFGPTLWWGIVLLAGWAAAAALMLLNIGKRSPTSHKILVVLGPLAVILLFAWQVPFLEARLLFPLYALLLLGCVVACAGIRPRHVSTACAGVLLLLTAVQTIPRMVFRLPSEAIRPLAWFVVVGTASVVLVGWICRRKGAREWLRRNGRIIATATALVLGSVVYVLWGPFHHDYHSVRYDGFAAMYSDEGAGWKWLYETHPEGGVRIAYVGTPRVYPLYGEFLRNRVQYVSIQEERRDFFHEYPKGALPERTGIHDYVRSLTRSGPRYGSWLARIEDEGIDYVFIYSGPGTAEDWVEREWAEADPERFRLVYEVKDRLWIFKVLRSRTPAAIPQDT